MTHHPPVAAEDQPTARDRRAALRVVVAQPETALGAVGRNVAAHAATVRSAAGDLVVFPELSLTGYDMRAETVTADDPRLDPLIEACREANTVALAGAPVALPGHGRGIGVLAVSGEGTTVAYTKMSLGDTEARSFRAGKRPAVIEVHGWRVGIGVCKDTRIADHLESTAALGIDLYVAGLAHRPDELDELEERARGIAGTYAVPVAFAAFAGPTGGGYDQTSGGSGIWDHRGERILQLGPEPGAIASTELDDVGHSEPPSRGAGRPIRTGEQTTITARRSTAPSRIRAPRGRP